VESRADERGTVRIDPRWLPALRARGLDSYSALISFAGDGPAREKRRRRIARVVFSAPPPGGASAAQGTPETPPAAPAPLLYLKQHLRTPLREALGDLFAGKAPRSAARREWEAIAALRRAGLDTMAPVALGERRRFPWLGGSFIATEGVSGTRLEDFAASFRGHFREKRCILLSLARCARLMHGAGFTHRDFYLCHLFLRSDGGLTLIDLQRVTRGGPGHRRRAVKDLAALNYSAPSPAVTRADRMRFLLAYLGRRRSGAAGRRLARRIARKTERIRRHDANKRAREALAAEGR